MTIQSSHPDSLRRQLSQTELTECGRKLGADYAKLGMPPPEDSPSSVLEGFAAAAHTSFRLRVLDRFERKYLQVRMGALRRHRLVSPTVTPDFLRSIDVSWCPVLRTTLTHGERVDTDWSVDRLNNHGAYAPGNIAVMSTRANAAKGALGYQEVRARSTAAGPTNGLAPQQWLRMACVMYGACHVDPAVRREWLPLATVIPNQSTWPVEFALQDSLLRASATSRQKNQLARNLECFKRSQQHHNNLLRLLERLHYSAKDLRYRHDALLDERIQREILEWYMNVPPPLLGSLRRVLSDIHGGESLSRERFRAWSTQTGGYLHPE